MARATACTFAGLALLAGIAGTPAGMVAGPAVAVELVAAELVTAELVTPPPADPGATPPTAATGPPLTVTVREVTPTSFVAGDPDRSLITVRASVRNSSTSTVDGLRARLVVQRGTMITRQALDTFATASATRSLGSATVSSERLDLTDAGSVRSELRPGESADLELTLQTADLALAAGTHGAAVEVLSGTTRVGLARTFLTTAAAAVAPTRVAILVPLVAGRGDDVGLLAGGAATQVQAGLGDGRLQRLLTATDDARISWAVDPALVDAVSAETRLNPAAAPADPGAAPTSGAPSGSAALEATPEAAGSAARNWLATVRREAAGRDVLTLPYGDPDLASLARTPVGADLLAAAASASREGDGEGSGVLGEANVRADIAWPADEAANTATAVLAAGAGDTAMVLDDRSQPPSDAQLTYTPTGRSSIAAGPTALDGLVADSSLSALLASAGTQAGNRQGQAALVQRLLAEVATTTLQRPNDARSLLIVAPRAFDPDPVTLQAVIAALDSSGWGQLEGLGAFLATPAPALERGAPALPPAAVRGQLPVGHVNAVAAVVNDVDAFGTALQGPDAALSQRRLAALSLVSTSWRGHNEELPDARSQVRAGVDGLTGGLRIVAGSVRTLAATRSELPVTVVNELDIPVTVDLQLRPRAPRVQLAAVPRQVLAARSQQRIAVPVRALANGSVVVDAQLRSPAGSAIGAPVPVTLNVRMGVEGWITTAVGAVAALLLVQGIVRAVRRPRRRMDEPEHALQPPTEVG